VVGGVRWMRRVRPHRWLGVVMAVEHGGVERPSQEASIASCRWATFERSPGRCSRRRAPPCRGRLRPGAVRPGLEEDRAPVGCSRDRAAVSISAYRQARVDRSAVAMACCRHARVGAWSPGRAGLIGGELRQRRRPSSVSSQAWTWSMPCRRRPGYPSTARYLQRGEYDAWIVSLGTDAARNLPAATPRVCCCRVPLPGCGVVQIGCAPPSISSTGRLPGRRRAVGR
jgi:hypothetical protein